MDTTVLQQVTTLNRRLSNVMQGERSRSDNGVSSVKNQQRNVMRREVLTRRDTLTTSERSSKSAAILARILGLAEMNKAVVVFSYMHFRSEVWTMDLIRRMLTANKTVTIPYTVRQDSRLLAVRITDPDVQVRPGYCGIPEPIFSPVEKEVIDPAVIDVAVVPGSVFDAQGGRLGYGGGYYDRFLAEKSPRAVRIGLAFDLQIVDRVPLESHDQSMDYVATESKLYDCRRAKRA